MSEKIKIEIYKTKDPGELTQILADPDSRLETGSGAALTAATAAALLCRAAALAKREGPGSERLDSIARNGEILRGYMVHLIDEDVKCRGPLRRALKEGGEREIEAARHPAVSICEEIVNMMGQALELLAELKTLCPREALHYVRAAGDLSMGAIRASMRYILNMSGKCGDETYRFVTRRENELTLAHCRELYEKLDGAE